MFGIRKKATAATLAVICAVAALFGLLLWKHGGTANYQAYAAGGSLSGSGTSSDPYLIDDAADLKAFALLLSSDKNNSSACAMLTADIDLGGSSSNQWTPIYVSGYQYEPSAYYCYSGTFDGNGKTISNLYISGVNQYQGLFSVIGKSGMVKNLTISNAYVNGQSDLGAIAGYSFGTISGCTVTESTITALQSVADNRVLECNTGGVAGYLSYGSIENCTVSNTEVNGYLDVGGIAGKFDAYDSCLKAVLSGCSTTNTTTVTAAGRVGGIVGYACNSYSYSTDTLITNCHNNATVKTSRSGDFSITDTGSYVYTGTVAGGVVGWSMGVSLSTCSNTGAVTSNLFYAGGIVAYASGSTGVSKINITNCYNTGIITPGSSSYSTYCRYAGGILGYIGLKPNQPDGTNGDVDDIGDGVLAATGTISYCYSTTYPSGTTHEDYNQIGAITPNYYNASLLDDTDPLMKKLDVTTSNCYAVKIWSNSKGTRKENVTVKTTGQFASGEVTYLLNENNSDRVWRQTIDADATPNFTGEKVGYYNGEYTNQTYVAQVDSNYYGQFTEALQAAVSAGTQSNPATLILLDDVVLDSTTYLHGTETNPVYIDIDLNGYTIEGCGTGSVFNVLSYANLTIKDTTSSGNGLIRNMKPISGDSTSSCIYIAGGTLKLVGGTITSDTSSTEKKCVNGGGVYVDYGDFIMEGGAISNAQVTDFGGGVYIGNGGTFTMNGGTVSQCTSSTSTGGGGGVYLASSQSKFIMTGGSIEDCKTYYAPGGGVYIANGTFTMEDGEISSNTAYNSNGVGGGVYLLYGTFTMNGGLIEFNKGNDGGGGVYAKGGTFSLTGGTIYGNETGNYSDGGGVYISGNAGFTMTGGSINSNSASMAKGKQLFIGSQNSDACTAIISGGTVSDGLQTSSQSYPAIYTSAGTLTITDGYFKGVIGHNSSYSPTLAFSGGYFSQSPASTYIASGCEVKDNTDSATNGEYPYKVVKPHKHAYSGTSGEITFTEFTSTGGELAAGSYYLTSDVELTEPLLITDGTVRICLNGYTLSNPSSIWTISVEGGSLYICDCDQSGSSGGIVNGGISLTRGRLYIYGGTVEGRIAQADGYLYIYGGTINSGIRLMGGYLYMYGGTVSGGEYSGTVSAITVTGGYVDIYGGTLSATSENMPAYCIYLSAGCVHLLCETDVGTVFIASKSGYLYGGYFDGDEFTGRVNVIYGVEDPYSGDIIVNQVYEDYYANYTVTIVNGQGKYVAAYDNYVNYNIVVELATYSINYETNGGTLSGEYAETYTCTVSATLPTADNISKSGYVFAGWYANSEFTGEAVTAISKTDTGDKTFYAKWLEVLTLTLSEQSVTYNGRAQKYSVVSGLTGFEVQYYVNGVWTTTAPTNVGEYAVKVTREADDDYAAFEQTSTFKIEKATLTIRAKDNSITYGESPAANGVTFDGFVNGQTASVLGGTLSYAYNYSAGDNVGYYSITPEGYTSDNYEINFVAGMLEVLCKDLSGAQITLGDKLTYNGDYQSQKVTSVVVDGVTLTNADYYVYNNDEMYAGNYTLVVEGVSNYTGSAYCDFTVYKADAWLENPRVHDTLVYGQSLSELSLIDDLIWGHWQWVDDTIIPTVADSDNDVRFPVVYYLSDYDKQNYDWSKITGYNEDEECVYSSVCVNVEKADGISPTVPSSPDYELTYGQTLADITLPDGWEWVNSATVPDASESVTYTARVAVDTVNYDWSGVSGVRDGWYYAEISVTVNKATPSYTQPEGLTATYGESLADITLPDGWHWDNPSALVGNTGAHTASATYTPDDTDNFESVTIELSYSVEQALPSAEQVQPVVNGGSEGTLYTSSQFPTLTAEQGSLSGMYAWDEGQRLTAGTHEYSYTFTPDDGNYTEYRGTVTLTVVAVTLTGIEVSTQPNKTLYTALTPFESDGMVITAKYNDSSTQDVTSEVSVSENATSLRYGTDGLVVITFTYQGKTTNLTVTVNKAVYDMSSVALVNTQFTYDGQGHSIYVSGGLPDGVAVSYTNNGQIDAGSYCITAHFTGDYENYEAIADMAATLNIIPASLTVTANDKTVTFSDSPANGGVTFEGFVDGQTESVLGGELTFIYNYSAGDNVGTYSITPSGYTSSNYDIRFVNGILTVERKSIENAVISVGDLLTYNGSEQTQEIVSVTIDGLTVTYDISGNNVTDAGNYKLTITGTGNFCGTVQLDFSVARKDITGASITLASALTYNGSEQIQGIDSVIIDGLTVTYSVSENVATLAGDYTLTVTGTGNFSGTINKAWIIAKAPAPIPVAPVVTGELTYSQSLSLLCLSDSWGWTDDTIIPAVSDSGVTQYYAFISVDDDNYDWTNVIGYSDGLYTVSVTVVVNKAVYDMSGVTFTGATVVEDGSAKSIYVTGTLPDGVTVSYLNNNQTASGAYTVTAVFAGDYDNYIEIADMSAVLTVNQAEIKYGENEDKTEVGVSSDQGLSPDIRLVVTKENQAPQQIEERVARNERISAVYDVKMQQNGVTVQPNGAVTVRMLISEDVAERSFRILYLSDGEAKEIEYSLDGAYAVFTVNELTQFAIVADNSGSALWLILVLSALLLAEIVLIVLKKVKTKGKDERLLAAGAFGGVIAIPEIVALVLLGVAVLALGAYTIYLYVPKKHTVETEGNAENETAVTAEEEEVISQPMAEEEESGTESQTPSVVVRYNRSLEAKLIMAEQNTKEYFAAIANYLSSFAGIRVRKSWKHLSFNKGRAQLAKIGVRGKTLWLFLALDPSEFKEGKYHGEDFSQTAQYKQVPFAVKIKSDYGLRRAKELINLLAGRQNIRQGEEKVAFSADDYPYDTQENLIVRKLIKVYADGEMTEGANLVSAGFEIRRSVTAIEAHSLIADSRVQSLYENADTAVENEYSARKKGRRFAVNIDVLSSSFVAGDTVDIAALKEKGIVPKKETAIKILARGTLDKPLIVRAEAFSTDAVKMIVLTGGKAVKI
ncbi:MAG: uL15 family ribosomal protein [Candidatus Coproplasma sp.]